jgi:hypothetical protein
MSDLQDNEEELNFEFEVPEFTLGDYESFDDFAIKEEDTLRGAIAQALFHAADLQIEAVPVCVFTDTDAMFMLNRDEYVPQLEKTLDYFSKLEEFEICAGLVAIREFL